MLKFSCSMFFGQILILILFLLILFFLIKEARIIKFQKRFDAFSLHSFKEQEGSFFDLFVNRIWNFVYSLRPFFSSFSFLLRYSKRYEKFIVYDDKDVKKGIDYVVLKFFSMTCGFVFALLLILGHVFPFSFLLCFCCLILGFYGPDVFWNFSYFRRRKQLEQDLFEAIIIMNHSFQSGRNIMQSVYLVQEKMQGPIRDEFRKIYLDMTYGLSIDVVFERFYERVGILEVQYISSTLTLLNKTGGSVSKIFSLILEGFYDKKKLKQEMKSLTTASIFMVRLFILLPIFFSLFLFLMSPDYFSPFFETTIGMILFFFIGCLYLGYILVIRKVLKVKLS